MAEGEKSNRATYPALVILIRVSHDRQKKFQGGQILLRKLGRMLFFRQFDSSLSGCLRTSVRTFSATVQTVFECSCVLDPVAISFPRKWYSASLAKSVHIIACGVHVLKKWVKNL
jgi:hypothetical protein